jgi:Domain of unknown function (DUF892)
LNLGSERAADVLSTVEGSAVEHYKIARYGISRPGPRSLGLNEAVKLLDMTLGEEKKTDETLTKLAETRSTSTHRRRDGERIEGRPRARITAASSACRALRQTSCRPRRRTIMMGSRGQPKNRCQHANVVSQPEATRASARKCSISLGSARDKLGLVIAAGCSSNLCHPSYYSWQADA